MKFFKSNYSLWSNGAENIGNVQGGWKSHDKGCLQSGESWRKLRWKVDVVLVGFCVNEDMLVTDKSFAKENKVRNPTSCGGASLSTETSFDEYFVWRDIVFGLALFLCVDGECLL